MTEPFEYYIKTNNITFKYAQGVSSRSGKEFHIFNEIILFLDGEAELITENTHIKLKPETLIVIPKETYHQLLISGNPENYHRCILNFEDATDILPLIRKSMSSPAIFETDNEIKYFFNVLKVSAKSNSHTKTLILKSALVLLLNKIAEKETTDIEESLQNETISRAIKFINNNLCKNIPIDIIAKDCNVSASALSHIFKKEMNIPLHQYIIKKRLILAYHKISSGKPATVAAEECGFNDYSGFYKQYKKMFGLSPSNSKQ